MSYYFAKPSYPLSLWVKQYWAIDDCLAQGQVHVQRIVPNGLMELMFYLGNWPVALDRRKQLCDCSVLSGQQKGYYDLLVSGRVSIFSIEFHPHGVNSFFDIPASEFFDQNVSLRDLVKVGVGELESALYEARTFDEKIGIVEQFLLQRLKRSGKEYETKRMAHCIALINREKGLVAIDELSSMACLSRKQLERAFSAFIGSSPKQFLRTVRFQNTLHQKHQHAALSLTELAYKCGYYDQSHMINDYKLLSGKTPTQYFSECDPYSDYFL